MADKHVDAITGTETTGHEWDGIRELNTPLPRWWLYTFFATIVWALAFYIFYPAWPWLGGYTLGVLGYSSRAEFAETMAAVDEGRVGWINKFEQLELAEIAEDPELLQYAMAGGRVIFAENCAPCHGSNGAGAPTFPVLVDDDWLWGGALEDIHETVMYGIRGDSDDARYSEMPAFGADEILEPDEISAVAEHVLSLSGAGPENEQGKALFEEQCVACHGEDGTGNVDMGAPNLTDGIWLYGGTEGAIVAQITKPRHGVMPPMGQRLDDAEVKQVTIYVHSLGGGQ